MFDRSLVSLEQCVGPSAGKTPRHPLPCHRLPSQTDMFWQKSAGKQNTLDSTDTPSKFWTYHPAQILTLDYQPVADPGFPTEHQPQGGGGGSTNLLFDHFFLKTERK